MRSARLGTLRRRIEFLLALTLAPAFALVLVGAYVTRTLEKRDVQQEAARVVAMAALAQEEMIRSADRIFRVWPHLSRSVPAVTDGCRELTAAFGSLEMVQNAGVLDPDGAVACSTRPVAAATNVSASAWFRAARDHTRLAVGAVERGPLTAAPTLVLARRLDVDTRGVVLFAALDLSRIGAALQEIPLPPGSSLTLIDAAGNIVARAPDHEKWVGTPAARTMAALTGVEGITEGTGVDGVQRLYGFHQVAASDGTPLLLTAGMPASVAYASVNRRLRLNLLVLTMVTIVAYLFARRVSTTLFGRKIDSVLKAARLLSAGDLSARTGEAWSPDELGELCRTFDAMAWTLEDRTRELHETVASLRALTARLESIREEERTRISREIHDELGQALTGIRMDLDRMDDHLGTATVTPEAVQAMRLKVSAARKLVDDATATARRVSRQLRPSVLDVLGLRPAVEWQLEELKARTGISAELIAEDGLPDLPESISVPLFRILQESLTNIMRHAQAGEVTVRLARESDTMVLEIMDNGTGFDPDTAGASRRSLGLLGMRERAAGLGGDLTVVSAPGRGTTVLVRVPLPPREEESAGR